MERQWAGQKSWVTYDGCIEGERTYADGRVVRKRKRRPAGATDDKCTWHPSVACPDHPNR